jgi:hypothetical protein
LFGKRYHIEFSSQHSLSQTEKREKYIMILILTLSTAFPTILSIGLLLDQKNPYGENVLELGFVTDKETEDFHSELPSRIAVLLAT